MSQDFTELERIVSRKDAAERIDEQALAIAAEPLVARAVRALGPKLPVEFSRADAMQEARIALLEAARNYEAGKGVPFAAWARMTIRHRLIDAGARERMPGGTPISAPRSAWREVAQNSSSPSLLSYIRRADAEEANEVAGEQDVLETVCRQQSGEELRVALGQLPERQEQVIRSLYGIDVTPARECELAERFGCTRDVIAALRRRALNGLALQMAA